VGTITGHCEKHDRAHRGASCRLCYAERRAAESSARAKRCAICGEKIARNTQGPHCAVCFYKAKRTHVEAVIREEAEVAPRLEPIPKEWGSAVILSDPHIPWHNPDVILDMCETAVLLKIKKLIIPGDLIHADTISKYVGVGKTVSVTSELQSTARVLRALEEVFDSIVIIPGNHDQRLERMIAGLRDTKDGRKGLDMVAALLGAGGFDDAEDVSLRYLRHFLHSPKVTWHPLPQMELNGTWLLQHPGSVSRIAPQNERAFVRKHRKSVIQGHSHLWGLGFDESGTDVAFNCGHAADDKKWRYVREKPSSFPASVHGYGVIYCTKDNPGGRLIPIAVHPRMFRVRDILEMAGVQS